MRDDHEGKVPEHVKGVYARPRADGTTAYRAMFLVSEDPETGKQKFRTETFDSWEEAEEWRMGLRGSRRAGTLTEPNKDRFGVYVRRYLDDVLRHRVRARTWEGYSDSLRRYLEELPEDAPQVAHVRMDQLRTEHIQRLYGWLQSERGLSPSTIRSLHAVVRQALKYAARTDAVSRNVAAQVKLPKPEKREAQAMSREELARFLRAADAYRTRPLWYLLPATGLRPGEALGLKWEDVDMEAGRLRVKRSLSRSGGTWKLTQPKTVRAARPVTLPPSTIRVLRAWRAVQAQERLKTGAEYEDHGFVFTTETGQPLDWTNTRRTFSRISRDAGLGKARPAPEKPEGEPGPRKLPRFTPAFRPYDLRHTCATLLLRSGENPKVVSERLGHHSAAFTMDVYAASMPDMQEGAAARMEDILGGEETGTGG